MSFLLGVLTIPSEAILALLAAIAVVTALMVVLHRNLVVQALFLAFFIGIVSGVVPSFGAARKSVAATLREVF